MLKLKSFVLLTIMLGLFFTSCNKDNTVIDPQIPTFEIPVKAVTSSLTGIVVDENGAPIENATIEVGTTNKTTDENGVFIIKEITMNELGTLVKVNKSGYFLGAQMIKPKAGKAANVRVILLTKDIVGTVASANGGTLIANGDSKITLPANGIINAAGDLYTGDVQVAAKWIDPTSKDLSAMMPGDLRAINTGQEEVQLATFGMLAVELESPSGEALNIAEGSMANLEFPVPAQLQPNAPTAIPLWYFDETTGYWIEEGVATFDGEKYVGEVSHFSFWNCDAPFPVVSMEGSLVDIDGNPIADAYINIKITSSGFSAMGITDATGAFSGKIAEGEVMTLTVKVSGQCNGPLHTEVIGPFDSDVILNPIVIDPANATLYTQVDLTGLLVNCAGDPVTDGYAKVNHNDNVHIYYPNDAGEIEGNFYVCEITPNVTVKAIDFVAEKQSNLLSYTTATGNQFDLGTIAICETIVEVFDYSIDGNDFSIIDPTARLDIDQLLIEGIGSGQQDSSYVSIQLTATGPGVYNPSNAYYLASTANTFGYGSCQGCTDFEVTITNFGNVGELIEGSFDGTMDGSGGPNTPISGTFKIERE